MSTTRATGWDRAEREDEATVVLCGYHVQVTERLSDYHAMQIGRQCPNCVAAQRVS